MIISTQKSKSIKQRIKAKGFALISTILIMSLLMLVALASLSLSSVETRSNRSLAPMLEAKANAKMALMLAIGELQSATGHDMSITASGSIINKNGFSKIDIHPSKQHYLMAFRTQNAPDKWEESRSESFNKYLVSGKNTDLTDLNYGSLEASSTGDFIRMTESSIPEEHQVRVPLVEVNNAQGVRSGSYGYWVSGQGTRASASLSNRAEQEREYLSPDRFNIKTAGDGNLEWLPDRDQPELLAKTVSSKTLEILSPDGSGLDKYQHWIGRNNRALLVDPTTGKFKNDLTAAFTEKTTASELEQKLGARMFPPAAGGKEGDSQDPGGPKWNQAKSYYQLNASSEGLEVRPQTEDEMGIYPVIAGFTEYYGLCNTNGYSPETKSGPFPSPDWFNRRKNSNNHLMWVMTMHMTPVVKLWNPYNRPLKSSAYTIAVGNSNFQYATGNQADNARAVWAGVRPSYLPLAMRFEHRYVIPDTTFAPGEVKIFTLRKNTFVDSYKRGTYTPGPSGKGTVGNIVDIIGDGYLLCELEEGDFTGHSVWDMHFTTKEAQEYDAENDPDNYYIMGRATGGWPLGESNDGSKTVINDSQSNSKTMQVSPGDMVNWSISLYKGKQKKSQSSSSARPLVTIKNINTAANNEIKFDPNLNEIDGLENNAPYFRDANLDGIWARTISLRMPENMGQSDATFLNPTKHGTKKVKWLSNFNPRSPSIGCWPAEYSKVKNADYAGDTLLLDGQKVGTNSFGLGTPGNYLSGIEMNLTSLDDVMPQPFIGYSDSGGIENCVLFDIRESESPEKHFFSVGQLRHANLTIQNGNYDDQLKAKFGMEDFFSDNLRPTYAIGESLSDIYLKSDTNNGRYRKMNIQDGNGNYESTHYDFTWHINKIWDSSFFSARDADEKGKASHNPRINLISPSEPLLSGVEGIERNATKVFLEGAFNVNSTSVEAWNAFLSSTLGAKYNANKDEDRAPFSRVSNAPEGMGDENSSDQDVQNYSGFRGLSSSEIQKLSEKIVEQVKQRGPFLSLADFVNRETKEGAPKEHSQKGALQAAIDMAELNKHLIEKETTIDAGNVAELYNKDAFAGAAGHSIPGFITQGDILARMGHLLTTRSDTFVIRAYGEARDSNGNVLARVWCEAEVQRFPEYVDHRDDAITPNSDLTSEQNKNYGRKYRVTSFRWIPTEEIQ